jgi:maleate cis-trans isomerase
MTSTEGLRVGFLSANYRWRPHYDEFLALLPSDVEVQIEGLGLWRESITELRGLADTHQAKTEELVAERAWQGIAVMGAPMQVQNPGLLDQLRSAVPVPVISALGASAAALKAFGVSRTLLVTPFDGPMNELLRAHLASEGIEAMLPSAGFADLEKATALEPEQVYRLALDGFAGSPGAQAVYFQGAPLNPLGVLERIEAELGVPVIASNPAMFWRLLSELGRTYSLEGAGRLFRDWPRLA